MDLHEDVEKAALDSGVDGVVDEFHHRVGRRAVVGEERGGDCWVDSLADGHTLGHYGSESIPELPFRFPIFPGAFSPGMVAFASGRAGLLATDLASAG